MHRKARTTVAFTQVNSEEGTLAELVEASGSITRADAMRTNATEEAADPKLG